MPFEGSEFYDDDASFKTYWSRRGDPGNANETLEEPALRELLGDPGGLDLLDLGCGDASFGKKLLAEGARSYLGMDGSANMIAAAEATLAATGGHAVRQDLDTWDGGAHAFDAVTARLVLHYLPALGPLFARVHQALRPGGLFVFSVEHPLMSACPRPQGDVMQRDEAWMVDDYFRSGPRVLPWMGADVVKHHRTIEQHFMALQAAGLAVEGLREARPERRHFPDDRTFERRQRVPLFLVMSARKPGEARPT